MKRTTEHVVGVDDSYTIDGYVILEMISTSK